MATKVADLFAFLTLKRDKRSFLLAQGGLNSVSTALFQLASIARTTTDFLINSFTEVGATAGKFDDFSKATGISSESLQGLEFAASQSGASIEDVERAVRRTARTLDQAFKGSKGAQEALENLFNSKATAKRIVNMENTEKALLLIADRFSELPPGIEKTALAEKIFGRSGVKLLNTLDLGSDGIVGFKKELQDLGGIIESDTGEKLAKSMSQVDKLKRAWFGFKITLASALVPTFNKVSERILNWVKANQALIKQGIAKFINSAIEVGKKLIDVVVKVGTSIWDSIGGWEGLVDILKSAIDFAGQLFGIMKKVIDFISKGLKGLQAIAQFGKQILGPIDLKKVAEALKREKEGIKLLQKANNLNKLEAKALAGTKKGQEQILDIQRAQTAAIVQRHDLLFNIQKTLKATVAAQNIQRPVANGNRNVNVNIPTTISTTINAANGEDGQALERRVVAAQRKELDNRNREIAATVSGNTGQ